MSVGSGFIAARTTTGSPFVTPPSIAAGAVRRAAAIRLDLVVRLRAAQARKCEAVADLDALDRLDAHERRREARVEAVGLLRVRAQAGRNARRHDLDDAAERVAVRPRGIGRGPPARLRRLAADLDDAAGHLDADLGEERLRDRAGGDLDRSLARARALERVADVVVAELERPREVGVTGARERDRRRALSARLARGRPRAHPPLPVRVVAVADDERERRSEREAVAQAGEHLDLVLLELLPRAAPVALPAAVEICGDRVAVEPEAGGQPGEDRDERRPVRLARGREARASRGQAYGVPHGLHRRGDARPELERSHALGEQHLEPGDDRAPARRAAAAVAVSGYGRSTSVWPGGELDEHLVALGGRVHDEVRVRRRPAARRRARENCRACGSACKNAVAVPPSPMTTGLSDGSPARIAASVR